MEKRKVVFTDFLDTIANRSIKYNTEDGRKELRTVQDFLNDYLDENNYMFILSALDHTSLDDFLLMFNELAKGVHKDKIKNLSFCITGLSDTYRLVKDYTLADTDIIVSHFDSNKKVITDSLISKFSIGKDDTVMAAGDSVHDINMLLRVHDIGGTSYYVDKHFLPMSDHLSINDMIRSIANHSYCKEQYLPIFNTLLEQYNSGAITKEELQAKYSTCQIADVCDCFVSNSGPVELQKKLEKKLTLVRTCDDVINNIK